MKVTGVRRCIACGSPFDHSNKEITLCRYCETALERMHGYVVPVVHGMWKRTRKYDEDSPVQCSQCLMEFDYIDGMCYLVTGSELPFYCPNCGAKMDGGK